MVMRQHFCFLSNYHTLQSTIGAVGRQLTTESTFPVGDWDSIPLRYWLPIWRPPQSSNAQWSSYPVGLQILGKQYLTECLSCTSIQWHEPRANSTHCQCDTWLSPWPGRLIGKFKMSPSCNCTLCEKNRIEKWWNTNWIRQIQAVSTVGIQLNISHKDLSFFVETNLELTSMNLRNIQAPIRNQYFQTHFDHSTASAVVCSHETWLAFSLHWL